MPLCGVIYFAYGANMERAAMRMRCVAATPLGPAVLRGWRYIIAQGYGSVARASGACVHGVLWRLTPRDLAALNAFESLESGLYRRAMLTVENGARRVRALVYIARQGGRPRPMPGYQERLVAAAQDWALPARYVAELARLAPGYRAGRPAETGEIA
jgi:gamma-glutamylcyclotransferase (GGCT)/AIG2-like uncharacterized protein YtfP